MALPGVVAVASCGPDADPPRCQGQATFALRFVPAQGFLPPDTTVRFVYGGGEETYSVAAPTEPEVVFCEPIVASAAGGAEAGAGGNGNGELPAGGAGGGGSAAADITELVCELWTGGTTRIEVTARGYQPLDDYVITSERDRCTLSRVVTLVPAEPHAE